MDSRLGAIRGTRPEAVVPVGPESQEPQSHEKLEPKQPTC